MAQSMEIGVVLSYKNPFLLKQQLRYFFATGQENTSCWRRCYITWAFKKGLAGDESRSILLTIL